MRFLLIAALVSMLSGCQTAKTHDARGGELSFAPDLYEDVFMADGEMELCQRFYELPGDCCTVPELVSEMRQYFASQLAALDTSLVVPAYATPTEVFVAPSIRPEIPTVFQSSQSDSAFVCRMLRKYSDDTETAQWYFDPCQTDHLPRSISTQQGELTLSYYRYDLSMPVQFRVWDRIAGRVIQIDGRYAHGNRCQAAYRLSQWGVSLILYYYDEGESEPIVDPNRIIKT